MLFAYQICNMNSSLFADVRMQTELYILISLKLRLCLDKSALTPYTLLGIV